MTIAKLFLTCTGALLAATLLPLADFAQAADQDRIIPRKDIFGNPTRTSPAISPDGKKIAYIAPRDGVLNVFVAPSDNIAAAKPITADKKRGIREFFWTQNSRQLIYIQDEGGDENWRIHVVDIATAKDTVISPAGKVQGQVIATSMTNPDAILIGINDRDPQNHDVYRHNLKTGEQVLLFRNDDGYSSFVADDSLAIRLVAKQTPGGGLEVFRRDSAGKLTPFTRISPEDALTTQLIGFDVAGTTLYALDSRGRDKAALVTLDVDSGAPNVLAQSEKADVSDTLAHPATGKIQAAQVEYLREEWQPVDPAIKSDIEFLDANARGEWKVTSRSRDDKWWTVRVDRVTEPVAFWLYDRGAKRFTKLFTARPNLEGAPLSPMYPVEIKARDGLTLVSYLTLPRGTDPGGSGKPIEGAADGALRSRRVHAHPSGAIHPVVQNVGPGIDGGGSRYGRSSRTKRVHQCGSSGHDPRLEVEVTFVPTYGTYDFALLAAGPSFDQRSRISNGDQMKSACSSSGCLSWIVWTDVRERTERRHPGRIPRAGRISVFMGSTGCSVLSGK